MLNQLSQMSGDFFKILIPTVWTIVCIVSVLAYALVPLGHGEQPRWTTMCLISSSLIPGFGTTYTVWKHLRQDHYNELVLDNDVHRDKIIVLQTQLNHEMYIAFFVLFLSLCSVVFFTFIAPRENGADISWGFITLCSALTWVIVVFVAGRRGINSNLIQPLSNDGVELATTSILTTSNIELEVVDNGDV